MALIVLKEDIVRQYGDEKIRVAKAGDEVHFVGLADNVFIVCTRDGTRLIIHSSQIDKDGRKQRR